MYIYSKKVFNHLNKIFLNKLRDYNSVYNVSISVDYDRLKVD